MNLKIEDTEYLMTILAGIYQEQLIEGNFNERSYEWHLGYQIIRQLESNDKIFNPSFPKHKLFGIRIVEHMDEPYEVRLLKEVTGVVI